MSLRDDIKKYRDADGLVALSPTFPGQRNASGNGLLYTSLYYICLALRKEVEIFNDRPDFLQLIGRCWKRDERGEPITGLLTRGPVQHDQEAMDDYVGVIAASNELVLPQIPYLILVYGRSHPVGPLSYVYQNVPGKFMWGAWLGRQPQFLAHLEFACGNVPPLWKRIWWALTIATSGLSNRDDQDARLFSWLLIQTAEEKSILCGLAAALWRWRLKRDWPGGMKAVVSRCLNQDHPIAQYWPDGV